MIFRGVLFSLSTLYQHLLVLLRDVASAKPMPFLTAFTLPADMAQLLDPSGAALLPKHLVLAPETKHHKGKLKGQKTSVKFKKKEVKRKVEEDLGMAVERGAELVYFI